MAEKTDASSPFIWPPVIYGSAALVSAAISWASPWPFSPSELGTVSIAAGAALILLGAAIAVAAERRFHAAGTPVPPTAPTKALVFGGIFRYSRNPMYLGMTLLLAGLGLAFDQLWFLLAVPIAVVAVTKLAIEREEAYLDRRFGAPYLAYKTQVRRWL